ncbi:MAG: glycosyltransferase [Candidatus Eremiobacteraeota bacterium]|nr:glycosyltransferase [Candidatus Eremiobacteraeota bacterium]MBC5827620.1 glycosyltransferase [Candidatus Eremiobacteraeota bacterium]
MLCLEVAAAAIWVYAIGAALADRRLCRRLRVRCGPQSASVAEGLPLVSIVVPMRNESRNVTAWTRAACAQLDVPVEILIADDDSTDDTVTQACREAAADRRVDVVSCPPPPAGWVGKPWAAYIGARKSKGAWLLFSDADMRMEKRTVALALSAAQESGADAISLTATLEAGTAWESIVLPAMASLIATGFPLFAIHDSASQVGLMWGGFILVRREAYFRCGGHAAVRSEIAEDRALAERLKAFGYRIRLFDGSMLVRVRMYHGFAEMWEGWRKNLYEGVRRNPILAAAFIAAIAAAMVMPLPLVGALLVVHERRGWKLRERTLAGLCAFGVGAALVVRALRDPAVGARSPAILGTPVAGAFIAAVMAASAWRTLSGRGQTWKDRTIL